LNPGGGDIFCSCPDPPWGPPSLLYNGYRVSFPGVKRPGRGASHPIPSSCRGPRTGRAIPLLHLLGPQGLLQGEPLPLPLHIPFILNTFFFFILLLTRFWSIKYQRGYWSFNLFLYSVTALGLRFGVILCYIPSILSNTSQFLELDYEIADPFHRFEHAPFSTHLIAIRYARRALIRPV
jgi:hypothetical protein